jgi:hypothetical protein
VVSMADLNDNDKYAMRLAFPGRPVVFRGRYATVTVVQGTDKALTADIRRPWGDTDYRAFPDSPGFGFTDAIAECASIAAHGPDAPVCDSDENGLCGHVQYGPERTDGQ